ncbi:hypothetical protein JXQ31_02710 [candidate division KSB1 bacterium]|nr:hypothetical protein [candidate division KSB1 bacterium]
MKQNFDLNILSSIDALSLRNETEATTNFRDVQMDVRYKPSGFLSMQLNNGDAGQYCLNPEYLCGLMTNLIKSPVKPVLYDKNRVRLLCELPVNNEQDLVQGYKYLKTALVQAAGELNHAKYVIPKQFKVSNKAVLKSELEAEITDNGIQDFSIDKIEEDRYLVYIETPRFYEKVNIFLDNSTDCFIYRAFLLSLSKDDFESETGLAVIFYLLHTLRDFQFVKPVFVQDRENMKLELQIVVPFFLRSTFTVEMAVRKLFTVLYVTKHPVKILTNKDAAKEYLSVVRDM